MLTIPKVGDSAAFFAYRMISKVVTECMNARERWGAGPRTRTVLETCWSLSQGGPIKR
jgi:hypothetical protein